MYLERMIGRAMEGEQFRQFKARGGWKELQEAVRNSLTHKGIHSDSFATFIHDITDY